MNIEIMIAILNQAANYMSLVGSYLMQTAAEMVTKGKLDQAELAMADSYNVLGNQVTTIAAAIYCILGQVAITQAISQATTTDTSNDQSEAGEGETTNAESDSAATTVGSLKVFRPKRAKKIRRRL